MGENAQYCVFDSNVWNSVMDRLVRHHMNVSKEVKDIIVQIRKDMDQNLVPKAEERANYGKVVKADIRRLWALEHEISDIQTKFVQSLGDIDLEKLTDDVVEDIMQQSKPLQIILLRIRHKQSDLVKEIGTKYEKEIAGLEPLVMEPEPVKKPEEEMKKKEEMPAPEVNGEAGQQEPEKTAEAATTALIEASA